MGCPGPHGHWSPWLAVLFHSSNLILGLAHLSIPLMIWVAWRGRSREGISGRDLFLAALFMPSMALSRFARVLEIFGPPYRFTTVVDCVAAALTVYSAYRLWFLVAHILKLPTREQLHDALNRLQAAVLDGDCARQDLIAMNGVLEGKIREAERKISGLEHDRKSSEWWKAKRDEFVDIQERFRVISGAGGGG